MFKFSPEWSTGQIASKPHRNLCNIREQLGAEAKFCGIRARFMPSHRKRFTLVKAWPMGISCWRSRVSGHVLCSDDTKINRSSWSSSRLNISFCKDLLFELIDTQRHKDGNRNTQTDTTHYKSH